MHIGRGVRLVFRLALRAARDSKDVHDVIMRRLELRLREKGEQAVVAAVTVDDDDFPAAIACHLVGRFLQQLQENQDRKSTRLNSSHGYISYAVFCLKKKKDILRTSDAIYEKNEDLAMIGENVIILTLRSAM